MFVIGSTVPSFDVLNATVGATDVRPGEAVDVTLSVTNSGGVDGTFDVVVLANGERVADDSLPVEAFGVATATLPVAFDGPGTYELTVMGEVVGTLTVESDQVTESTPSPTSTPTPQEESNDGGSGLLTIVIGLLALIAIASLVHLRRDDA